MYYEEKVIDGILCWRGTPTGEWKPVSYKEMTKKLIKVKAASQELLESLEAIVPPVDDWWCPTCKAIPASVTYEECCDKCGTFLGNVSDPEWIAKARAAIAKANG